MSRRWDRGRAFRANARRGVRRRVPKPPGGVARSSDIGRPTAWRSCAGTPDPFNSPVQQDVVTREPTIAIVNARVERDYAPLGHPKCPNWPADTIQIQDDAMPGSAGAVEHQPLVVPCGRHQVGATRTDVRRHLVHVRDRGFQLPSAGRQALGKRVQTPRGKQPPQSAEQRAEPRTHGQTCARNGSVHPRPSLPLLGWQ